MDLISNRFNWVGIQNHVSQKPAKFVGFKNNALDSDVVSFKSSKNNSDWKKLVPRLNFYIKDKNFLGGGIDANVYKINDKYVLRLFGGTKFVKPQPFESQVDIFEGRNYGQSVAKSRDKKVSINKLVSGKQLYKINQYDEKTYMENLRKYVNLPDEVLEDFVENVAFINSKGYRIDESNPENFLYDEKNQKIGIVDICKKGTTSLDLYGPYSHFWILEPLVNGHDYSEIYKRLNISERKEMIDLILKLQDRIIPMCQKHGIPVMEAKRGDYDIFDLPLFLANLDKFDINSQEGIVTQMARIQEPELLIGLENWDYRN